MSESEIAFETIQLAKQEEKQQMDAWPFYILFFIVLQTVGIIR